MFSQGRLQAVFDCALSDNHGLELIHELGPLKTVFRKIAEVMNPIELLDRARFTAYPDELLVLLTEIVGPRSDKLELLVRNLYESSMDDFGLRAIRTLADAYWSTLVRERLVRGDYRRAWDEVREAYRGFSNYKVRPGHPPMPGGTSQMAASFPTLHTLVEEVYEHMRRKGLVSWIENDSIRAPASAHYFRPVPDVAGWPFAIAINGVNRINSTVNRWGQMVLVIVRALNAERRKKRTNRIATKLKGEI